jgi:hypothetical protein
MFLKMSAARTLVAPRSRWQNHDKMQFFAS